VRALRTPEDTDREYGRDKWGGLLKRVSNKGNGVRLTDADRWAQGGDERTLMWIADSLVEVTAAEAHRRYRDVIADELSRFLPATGLVELGAGYGSILIHLAKRPQFVAMPVIGADLTESGVALIDRLAAAEGRQVTSGKCDLASAELTDIEIPDGSLVYTSFALQCIPLVGESFVGALCARRPAVVVHFEPAYEHCDQKSLLGLLRRRYIQVNDYNTNLITLLHEQQGRGSIEILEERPAVVGPNPLLPASVIVWRPSPTS